MGYPIALSRIHDLPGYSDANVHYEFRDEEARVEVFFDSGASVTMVWPSSSSDIDPFFYFDYRPGMNAKRRQQVIDHLPSIGIIPGLNPVEDVEEVLSARYVAEAAGSRLTSRHFRNHLFQLQSQNPKEYIEAIEFIYANTPEISDISMRSRVTGSGVVLDMFFKEATGHSERELVWAGDGMQIWLQIMFHAFRQRRAHALVLDEPDVFLHPDLQRRLIAVLEGLGPQIVLATHASELIAEAPRDSIVLVDRLRKNSRRIRDTPEMDRLVSDLGSAFDLAIARALRSRVVLFVEGKDMKLLRRLAATVGAKQLASERGGVVVVPLGGYNNWPHVQPFALLKSALLQDAVKMIVLLDRDYRGDQKVTEVEGELRELGIVPHVWRRKEIESYLLHQDAISRVSGLPAEKCGELLAEAVELEAEAVEGDLFSEMMKSSKGKDPSIVHAECRARFLHLWQDFNAKLKVVPPKRVISSLNSQISANGGTVLSSQKLAEAIRIDEVDSEIKDVLLRVESEILGLQR